MENIRVVRKNFSNYCLVCHGLDGQNTGVPFADRMSPPVPLLTSPTVQSYSDGQLKWVIDHGIFPSGMPYMSMREVCEVKLRALLRRVIPVRSRYSR